MPDDAPRYLTVAETARYLRIVPQTVYRWCRTGKLQALKIGKAWRIPAEQLERGPALGGFLPLDTLLARLHGNPEHLLGLASDRIGLAVMEATFFDVAAAKGFPLVYARWEESERDVRHRLQSIVGGVKGGRGGLRILDFKKAYEEDGEEGTAKLLLRAINRKSADQAPCHVFESSYSYFSYNVAGLIEYERGMGAHLRNQPAFFLSGHVLNYLVSLYGTRSLNALMALTDCHSGIICFDGQRASLLRPAGRGA